MSEYHTTETAGNYSQHLIFHGSGKRYFPIWIVNVVLTIFTLGIFYPWAVVRSKCYLYENTELDGARFSYHARGSAMFLSFFLLTIMYAVFMAAVHYQHNGLACLIIGIFFFFFPYMIIQGTRYQMMMTQLNHIRFNFRSNGFQAWVRLVGLPLSLFILSIIIFIFLFFVMRSLFLLTSITTSVFINSIALLIAAIVVGIVFSKWYSILYNGLEFGQLKFNAVIEVKKVIYISCISVLLLLPFIFLVIMTLGTVYLSDPISSIVVTGMNSPITRAMMTNVSPFIIGYFIYNIGLMVSNCFFFSALRRYTFGVVRLDDRIKFRSTATFKGYLWQGITNLLLVLFTLALAYPWAKVRFTRYLAENTWIDGDLDSLDLQDHHQQPATDLVSQLSRGIIVT